MIIKNSFVKFILFIVVVSSNSCGDLFDQHKRITGNYYLSKHEMTGGFSIFYKTSSGDYIGRSFGKLLEYGFTNKFIVLKNDVDARVVFYIINRSKDSEYAEKIDFLIGPLTEPAYDSLRKALNLNVLLIKP